MADGHVLPTRELSRNGLGGASGELRRLSSASGSLPLGGTAGGGGGAAALTSPPAMGTPGGGGGSEEEVPLVDYGLGRNNCRCATAGGRAHERRMRACGQGRGLSEWGPGPRSRPRQQLTCALRAAPGRIRWSQLDGSDAPLLRADARALAGAHSGPVGEASAASASGPHLGALQPPPATGQRGVIPFGVNRPFAPPAPPAPRGGALTFGLPAPPDDSDADDDEAGWVGPNAWQPRRRSGAGGGSGPVSRQLTPASGGTASGGAFARGPPRRSSLFGKVFALNVGDAPLLRLLLQVGGGAGGEAASAGTVRRRDAAEGSLWRA
jgi:hypothetical protein